jgi:hypothetical protein
VHINLPHGLSLAKCPIRASGRAVTAERSESVRERFG